MRYCLHGVNLELAEDVPAWPRSAKQATPAWAVRIDHEGAALTEAGLVRAGAPQWHWTGEPTAPTGVATLTVTGGPGEGSATRYIVDWPNRTIEVAYTHAAADGWAGTVELLTRWVVPMIARASADDLPLHATTVMLDGQALLIAGPSGAGKSTLTAALLNAGAELLGDEPAAVRVGEGRLSVWPGEATVRLHQAGQPAAQLAHPHPEAPPKKAWLAEFSTFAEPPAAEPPAAAPPTPAPPAGTQLAGTRFGKAVFRSITPHPGDKPIPVLALCLLGPRHAGAQPQLTALPADVALTRLMAERYSFPGRPSAVRSDFAAAARVASTGRVVELQMPNSLEQLQSAAASLWDALRGAVE